MSTKTHVLSILEEKKGSTVSGEELANQLQVSRAAIWKAIQELRKEGYTIDAITNRGYSLSSESDVLSIQGIQPYLRHQEVSDKIQVFKTLESTNQTAKRLALDGAPVGTAVISEEQTKGRGRRGRSFFSPSDSGIYMSMLLEPRFDVSKSVLITTAASVAVCKAIEKVCGIDCQIKWVNDVYYRNKKICGILTEAVTDFESGHIESIILGIGVNFSTAKSAFPQELTETAGSLFEGISTGEISRNRLIAEIIDQVLTINDQLESRAFIPEYKKRSFVLGKDIRVFQTITPASDPDAEEAPIAKAVDIDDDGGLVVQYQDGSIATLNSGEISIRLT